MLQELIELDKLWFYYINGVWHHPVLDVILPLLRNKLIWLPLYVFLVSFVAINFKWKGLGLLLALGLSVGLADVTSSRLVKKSVERVRPCNDPEVKVMTRSLIRCGGGYSFTSSHATNHFSVAVFLAFTLGIIWPWVRWAAILWAAAISYAQVYVGVHYPLDVMGGALLGILIGGGVAFLFHKSTPGRAFFRSQKQS